MIQPVALAATGDVTQDVINSQLQIMQAQLQLLTGQPMAAAAPQAATAAVAAVEPTAAPTPACETPAKVEAKAPAAAQQQQDDAPPKAKRFSTVKLNDGTLDEKQQAALDEIIRMNCAMMPKSKAYAQEPGASKLHG